MKFEKFLLITNEVVKDDYLESLKIRINNHEEETARLFIRQLGLDARSMEGEGYLAKTVIYLTNCFKEDEKFVNKYEPKAISQRLDFFQELSNSIFSRKEEFFIKLYIAGLIEVEVPLFKYIPWKEKSPEAEHLILLVKERENNE